MAHDPYTFLVTTPSGAVIDLAPLIEAARALRHNAMIAREHGQETAASRMDIAAATLGMKIAVKHLVGDEALAIFERELDVRNNGR